MRARGERVGSYQRRHERGEVRAPSASKRDTKKWCRGKVGTPHTPKCVSYDDLKNRSFKIPQWKVLVCTVCQKQLAHWWPSPFRPTVDKAPDWVT